MSAITKVAVVYHSGYGHTKAQAEAVHKGVAGVAGIAATIITTEEAIKDWAPLNEADCIIFGTPTYMGSASAKFKEFQEAASKIWFGQGWKDKLAAGFTNSGGLNGDKQNTLTQLWVNAMQHGMIWVSQAIMPDGKANRLGSWGGAMSQSPQESKVPVSEDLVTAERFGRRVAEAAVRWVRGRQ
jgi:NAD(P)H dehydrogenase (quinone)